MDRIRGLTAKGQKYSDFNTCHLHDMLGDHEDIVIGRSTLDRLMAPQNRKSKDAGTIKRRRRQRSGAEGMMLQIDGSPHDWLEGRGPKMSLIGAVDDATGAIIYAVFRPTEDSAGYLIDERQLLFPAGNSNCRSSP